MAPHNEDTMPLDIAYSKLLDWLIERKKLSYSWQDAVRSIREQINGALTELPDVPEITDMLKGKYLHYFHCRRIMQLLESAEQGRSKNIFGQYTSKLLRTWSTLLKSYEKDNVYIGEAGRILIQNTSYTCPSLKKAIAQYEKQITDCSRRVVEYGKTIGDFERKLAQSCKELGIAGKDYRSELRALTSELPAMYDDMEASLSSELIGQALQYHAAVWAFLHDKRMEDAPSDKTAFVMLRRVRAGERRTGGRSKKGAANNNNNSNSSNNSNDDSTGGGGGGDMAPFDLDLLSNLDLDAALPEGGEVEEGGVVDWGEEGGGGGGDAGVVEIDWEGGGEVEWEVEMEEAGAGGGGGGGDGKEGEEEDWEEGDSLLSDGAFRGHLLDDLLELEAFLLHRRVELSDDEGSSAFVMTYQSGDSSNASGAAIMQSQTVASVERGLEAVRVCLSALRAPKFQQLVMIKSSPAYLDRLVRGLYQKGEHIVKLGRAAKETVDRKEEARAALARAVPEYEVTVSETKALKKQVEGAISQLYKGRPINIIGEINCL